RSALHHRQRVWRGRHRVVSCPYAAILLPDAGDWVRGKRGITADHRYLLDHRLGDNEPIKRITVVERQRGQNRRVSGCNGQNEEPVAYNALLHEYLVGL